MFNLPNLYVLNMQKLLVQLHSKCIGKGRNYADIFRKYLINVFHSQMKFLKITVLRLVRSS